MKHHLTTPLLACSLLTAGARAQCELRQWIPPGTAALDIVGGDVAIEDDVIVVSAVGDDDLGAQSGAVHVLERDASGWSVYTKLTPSDGTTSDSFGGACAVASGRIFVGTNSVDGAVYVFEKSSGSWIETARIAPADVVQGDAFGWSLDVEGDRALIGAWGAGPELQQGAAYIFELRQGVWVEVAKLAASDAQAYEEFGHNVALSGDRALIGTSPWSSTGRPGAAYVFERAGSAWVEVAKLTASDGAPNDQFGSALDLAGELALIGAPADNDLGHLSGSVYAFELLGGSWVERQKILPELDTPFIATFGMSLQIAGEKAIIGSGIERAYLFERSFGAWRQHAILGVGDYLEEDGFGYAVAAGRSVAVVGAPLDNTIGLNAGASYLFSIDHGTSYCQSTHNSTGRPALLRLDGCDSVSANQFTLVASPVPEGSGIFFYGAAGTELPFGDGFQCVDEPLLRLLPLVKTIGGEQRYTFDLNRPPQRFGEILPGSTWRFQLWFTDAAAGGSGFNTSDALAVTFQH
jgi:hypothetical protein